MNLSRVSSLFTAAAVLGGCLNAAPLSEARVSRVVNRVEVISTSTTPHAAQLSETIRGEQGLRTGEESRSELIFSDQTLCRLGSNSLFSFKTGTRDMELKSGVLLLQCPKGAGGAQIVTPAVTAGITGTTIMVECSPRKEGQTEAYVKVIVVEGTLQLSVPGRLGESTLIEAGKMIIMPPGARDIPRPVDVDISRLVHTSRLISGFDDKEGATLDKGPITQAIVAQKEDFREGDIKPTELVIRGKGTLLESDALRRRYEQSKALTNSGFSIGPDLFGAPSANATFNPLIIDNQTSIYNNGYIVNSQGTALGSIWRNTTQDGQLFQFSLARPTSDIATALTNITGDTTYTNNLVDTFFDNTGQYGVFRAPSIQLAGTPSQFPSGTVPNLFFVGDNGISTTGSGTFDISPYNFMVLGTRNGPINLGAGYSFTGTSNKLVLLGLGANGNINVGANISLPVSTGQLLTSGGNAIPNFIALSEQAINLSGNFDVSSLQAAAYGNVTSSGTIRNGVNVADSVYLNSSLLATAQGGSINAVDLTLDGGSGVQSTGALLNGQNVNLYSSGSTGAGVVITNSTVLASYLSASSSSPIQITVEDFGLGGVIVSNSTVNSLGTLNVITSSGSILLQNSTLQAATLNIYTQGANGTININGGTLQGDTALALYAGNATATGGGGTSAIQFIGNTTLSTQSFAQIQAHTVGVSNGVTVNVVSPNPANITAAVPNYSSLNGGNGATTGQFILNGNAAVSGANTSVGP